MPNIKIDESTRLIGKVRLGDKSYIAQGSILRSIDDRITIANSSVENSVLIELLNTPIKIG